MFVSCVCQILQISAKTGSDFQGQMKTKPCGPHDEVAD